MTGYESKRAAAQDKLAQPEQEPTLQEEDRKRGSIALARSLCYQINGAADDSDDMDGGGYGSVDIAEILSAEVVRLQAALAQPAQEPWPEEPLGHMAWGVQSAQEHCQCPACKDGKLHWSDCVVHDETPLAAELCNCGVVNPRIVTQQQDTPSEAFFDWWGSDYNDSSNPFKKNNFAYWAFAGWQAALAQPAQEPVSWAVVGDGKFGEYELGQVFVDYASTHTYWENRGYELVPVYTTLPQRLWVDLTDEDIALIDWESLTTKKDCVRAIEQISKERNA